MNSAFVTKGYSNISLVAASTVTEEPISASVTMAVTVNCSSTDTNATSTDSGFEYIFLIVLYVLLGTIGIVGNSLVCLVFGLMRSRRTQVNLFIFHQALVDLLASLLLITFGITQIYKDEITALTTTGEVDKAPNPCIVETTVSEKPTEGFRKVSYALLVFMCRLWWPRVFLFSMFAISTSNLTAMAIERYVAIMHPFVYATKFRRRHALMAIAGIWIFGPFLQFFPAIFQYEADEHGHCGVQATWTKKAQAAFGVCLTTWEFFTPCVIMGFSSISIYRRLYSRSKYLGRTTTVLLTENGRALPTPENSEQLVKANRNTTTVVIMVFICYIVCWSPNHLTFLGFNLGMHLDFTGRWYHTTVFLAFLNSCINPFIYALRLRVFQKGMAHICRTGCKPVNSSNFDSTAMATHYDVNATMTR